jgi:hypothetical protein
MGASARTRARGERDGGQGDKRVAGVRSRIPRDRGRAVNPARSSPLPFGAAAGHWRAGPGGKRTWTHGLWGVRVSPVSGVSPRRRVASQPRHVVAVRGALCLLCSSSAPMTFCSSSARMTFYFPGLVLHWTGVLYYCTTQHSPSAVGTHTLSFLCSLRNTKCFGSMLTACLEWRDRKQMNEKKNVVKFQQKKRRNMMSM